MADAERYRGNLERPSFTAPAVCGEAVTPHDTTKLTYESRALYVGVGGDVTVLMADGTTTLTFVNVPTGSWLPLRVQRVDDTGTDAQSIVAVY